MIRRRRRTIGSKESATPLSHETALDAAEKLRDMTPERRAKEWKALRPRIVAGILNGGIYPVSASAVRKQQIAEGVADLYLKHAEGKTPFLPLRAPQAMRLDDYRESTE
ncbi:hypothetical protein [Steroidobacter sp.]|uniref:hypothetical protein n=1 Tax=Steroidobacter sp. TaxID=1978227 RepID=UPI001A5A4FB9|nr:hypothetical protein [Steroidobacter sp.]MBL8269562.1 hypothetical protein [Steroidobacter sp.]